MNFKPRFSIILPTYNRAQLIARAIKSVINQTCKDFELIVIDDGSTDDTEKVVKSFSSLNIWYERLSRNKGVNAARNKGLDLSKGEYIVFLDSDDELLPDALKTFLNLWSNINDKKIGNIVTRCIDSKTREKIGYLSEDNLLLEYRDIVCREKIKGEFRSCWRKDAIGEMRFEEEVFAMESILWQRLAKKYNFLFRDVPTTVYYKNSPLTLCSKNLQFKNATKIAKGYEIIVTEHGDALKYCPSRYCQYLNSASLFNLLSGDKDKSRYWSKKSLRVNLFNLKGWAIFILTFLPKSIRNIVLTLILGKRI